jgi:hypothetical protein
MERGMRILGMTFQDNTARFRCPLVMDKPLSESEGLEPNYIHWLGNADLQRLRDQTFPFGDEPPLLYLLLRHAMLSEFRVAALQSRAEQDRSRPQAMEAALAETELVRATPETRDQATIWEVFEQPVAGLTGRNTLWQHLRAECSAGRCAQSTLQRLVSSFMASLRYLEGLPTAELERLFTETLDVCSHRLDAWITSLATWRLEGMRQQRPLELSSRRLWLGGGPAARRN